MEKLRAQQEEEVAYKGFNHAYWAFTKSDMSQTLSITTEADEASALEVFHLVLTYAGLMQQHTVGKNAAFFVLLCHSSQKGMILSHICRK